MKAQYNVAIIGLGVIGQRMLANMPTQDRLTIIGGWDSNPQVCRAAKEAFPWLTIAESAQSLIANAETDLVYIGVPPMAHREYALAAIAANKAVFCEKPLGVDLADSRDLTERMESSGLKQAVNFVYGAARGAERIRAAIDNGETGEISSVDVRLHFARWPRDWQETATWLSERKEGGFTREVLSHFVFLTEKLFGPSTLVSRTVTYPPHPEGAAETHVLAQLACGGTPITVAGTVGGSGPDLVEYTVWGEKRSYRLTQWYRLLTSDGGKWQDATSDITDLGLDAYDLQFRNLISMLDGKSHTLPDFRAALSVQERIEEMLTAP